MAVVRLIALAALAGSACRASEAGPTAGPSGLVAPAGWKALPSIATAAQDAAKSAGLKVDAVEAWGEPARGCYGAWLSATDGAGTPTTLADQLVQGLQTEPALQGIAVTDVVKPVAASDPGVLALTFAKAPYTGHLHASFAKTGHMVLLACFWNEREPAACDAACKKLMGGWP